MTAGEHKKPDDHVTWKDMADLYTRVARLETKINAVLWLNAAWATALIITLLKLTIH